MALYMFVTGVILSLIFTPITGVIAYRIGAVDQPNGRKIHKNSMPRLGGLGIYLSFIISLFIYFPIEGDVVGLLIGGTVVLIVGIFDDIMTLRPSVKLMGQIFAAILFVLLGSQVQFISNPFDGLFYLGVLSIPVTIFWIVGVTNAVNLIDGLDGLASGVSGIALTAFVLISYLSGQSLVAQTALGLLGAVVGFLKFNFYPAKIFLGDSGALFLGYTIACMSVMGLLKSVTLVTFLIPILILGVPIFDTCFAILRRYLSKKPIFQADAGHLHHKLLELGFSHKQTVLVIYVLSMGLGMSAVLFVRNGF